MKALPALTSALFLLGSAPLPAADLRRMLSDGLYQEEVERKPEAAVKVYQEVIEQDESQRAFAATAQFRLAELHRKQGRKDEAIAAYRKLITRYPEAKEETRLAKEALTALGVADIPPSEAPRDTAPTDEEILAKMPEMERTRPDELFKVDNFEARIKSNQLKSLAYLIDHSAPPLHPRILEAARAEGSLDAVRMILKQGVDPTTPGAQQTMVNAVANSQVNILQLLLENDLDVNSSVSEAKVPSVTLEDNLESRRRQAMSNFQGTPLNAAIAGGNPRILEMILEAKPEVNLAASPTGFTPLHLAAWMEDSTMIKRLLALGADPNKLSKPLLSMEEQLRFAERAPVYSPLDIALRLEDQASIALLSQAGGKPNSPGLLIGPLTMQNYLKIELMLKYGVSTAKITKLENFIPAFTSPEDSRYDNNRRIIRLLAEHEMKIDTDFLRSLIAADDVELMSIILKHKAYTDDFLKDPGLLITNARSDAMLDTLFLGGLKAPKGKLTDAVKAGNTRLVKAMLAGGADPNERVNPARSLLAYDTKPEIVQLLLDSGMQLEGASGGNSLLCEGVESKRLEIAKLLLERGANPNPTGSDRSPLRLAAEGNGAEAIEIVKLLIRKGAKPEESWLKAGLAMGSSTNDPSAPARRSLLFRTFQVQSLEDSPDIRWVGQSPESTRIFSLQEKASSAIRPLAELILSSKQLAMDWTSPTGLVIWRKDANGVRQPIEIPLDADTPFPALEWGDLVEAFHAEGTPWVGWGMRNEVRWNLLKRISFPITIEADGQEKSYTVRGDTLTFDPSGTVIPWGSVFRIAAFMGIAESGQGKLTDIGIKRPDQPEIVIPYDPYGNTIFFPAAGDRLRWIVAPDDGRIRKNQVTVISEGLPFHRALGDRFNDQLSGPTIPTLLQALAELYAPRETVTPAPKNAEEIPAWFASPYQSPFEKDRKAGLPAITLLAHPDFSRIRIRRPMANGSEKVTEVNLSEIIRAAGDSPSIEEARRKDITLVGGEIVEIPVIPGSAGTPWSGFTAAEEAFFSAALNCQVQQTMDDGTVVMRDIRYRAPRITATPAGLISLPPAEGTASLTAASALGRYGTLVIGEDYTVSSSDKPYANVYLSEGLRISGGKERADFWFELNYGRPRPQTATPR